MRHPQVQLPSHIARHTQAELGLNAAFRGLGTESQVPGLGHIGFLPCWAEDTMFQDCCDYKGDAWVGGEPNWFCLLPGLVLVPDALGYEEDLPCQPRTRILPEVPHHEIVCPVQQPFRQDLPSHPAWLLTGNTEYKTCSMLRWLIYAPPSGVNSFLYNGNVPPCPLIFMFLAFPTALMNHLSHEAFSRMIFLPEVFLFPSGNFHCGINRSALSSSYESHPLGMNFLVAEDRFFSLYLPCLEICEWNGTRLPPHRRVSLAKTDCISAGARLYPEHAEYKTEPTDPKKTGGERSQSISSAGRGPWWVKLLHSEEIMYRGQSGHHFLRILEHNAHFVNESRYATGNLTLGLLHQTGVMAVTHLEQIWRLLVLDR